MIKRFFDIILSFLGLLLLSPFLLFLSIWIIIDSKGGVFYKQKRVGKNNNDFFLYKLRSMKPNSEKKGLLTVGKRDNRITKSGFFIRKYKLDELPQLFNILKGDMSIVGPRPEVRKYVNLYNQKQLDVLSVRPGLTDFASLEYINENEILGASENPEKQYIEEVMPAKLLLNLKYINQQNFSTDIKIIFKTIGKIFGN